MIEEKLAKDQIRRLSGLSFFPKDTKAVHELVLALMVCEKDSQAMRVITDIIANSPECPAPAIIRGMSYDRAETERAAKVQPIRRAAHCPICHDAGFFGGHLPGNKNAGPWQWCDCAAAREERHRNPNLVDDANRAREKLIAKFPGAASMGEIVNTLAARKEIYHGTF
jgi:hypothetical protein